MLHHLSFAVTDLAHSAAFYDTTPSALGYARVWADETIVAIQELKEKSIILLREFHLFLQDPNPILIRQLKDVLQRAKTQNKTLIVLGCRLCLPPELERELTVIEFARPGKQELRMVLGGIMESAGIQSMENEARDEVVDAASGLTVIEVGLDVLKEWLLKRRHAFSQRAIEYGQPTPKGV